MISFSRSLGLLLRRRCENNPLSCSGFVKRAEDPETGDGIRLGPHAFRDPDFRLRMVTPELPPGVYRLDRPNGYREPYGYLSEAEKERRRIGFPLGKRLDASITKPPKPPAMSRVLDVSDLARRVRDWRARLYEAGKKVPLTNTRMFLESIGRASDVVETGDDHDITMKLQLNPMLFKGLVRGNKNLDDVTKWLIFLRNIRNAGIRRLPMGGKTGREPINVMHVPHQVPPVALFHELGHRVAELAYPRLSEYLNSFQPTKPGEPLFRDYQAAENRAKMINRHIDPEDFAVSSVIRNILPIVGREALADWEALGIRNRYNALRHREFKKVPLSDFRYLANAIFTYPTARLIHYIEDNMTNYPTYAALAKWNKAVAGSPAKYETSGSKKSP